MRLRYIWVILFLIMAAQIIGTFSTEGITAPLGAFYRDELSLSRAQVGSLTSAVFLGMGLLSLAAGWLVDFYGIRLVLSIGLLIMAVAAALFAQARSYVPFWCTALLGGVGYSVIQPSTVKGIISWFPGRIRGTMVSIKQSGVSLGASLAASLLVFVASISGWRQAATIAALTALAAAFLVAALYREPNGDGGEQVRRKSKDPSLFRLFRENRNLKLLMLIGLARTASHYSAVAYLILSLVETGYYQVTSAAMFLTVMQLTGALSNIGWGALNDTYAAGKRKTLLTVIVSAGILGALILTFLPSRPHPSLVLLGVTLFGMGVSGGNGLFSVTTAELGGAGNMGSVVGIYMTASCVGTVLGPPIFGWVVDRFGNYRWAWGLIVLYAVSILLAVRFLRLDQQTVDVCRNKPSKDVPGVCSI